ncbi:uncharacterized protein LY89DRAFT_577048, partial [Mollisia scopiformis]
KVNWCFRKRHLKCDEGKPSCLKCIKGKFECTYQTSSPLSKGKKSREQTAKLLALAPRPIRSREAPDSTPSIIQQPASFNLKTAREAHYFRFFCTNVAVQLSGLFDLSLWNRLILQTSEEEESVRRGIIALGALQQSINQKGEQNNRYLASIAPNDEHHRYSVEQYQRAIKLMRHSISLRTHSLRTTLLNCLLAICFETMHGNDQSAIAQMEVGVRLLDDYISSKRISSPRQGRNIPAASPDFHEHPISPSYALESPAPHEIEDELVHAFTRLDTQANSFLDARPLEHHMVMRFHGSDCLARMPTTYCSIDEARKYHELLGRRVSHWTSTLGGRNFFFNEYHVVLDDQKEGSIPKTHSIPEEVYMERQEHLDDLDRWWQAFTPLWIRYQYQMDSREYLCAVNLRLRFVVTRLMLSMALVANQLLFDEHIDEFHEVVYLAKILHSSSLAEGPLSFDLGYIPALFTVTSKCRDRRVRREAAHLLLSKAWREGLWESNVTGRVSAAVIDIEEEGLQGDFVPEEARIKSMRLRFDLPSKELRLSCTMASGDIKDRTIMW